MKSKRRIVVLVLVILVGVSIPASLVTLDTYAISPGQALDVGKLVTVEGFKSYRPKGAIMMTDVVLTRLTPLEWLFYHLSRSVDFVPGENVVGNQTNSEFLASQAQEMVDAKSSAAVAALRYLKLPVKVTHGALILEVLPGTPASTELRDGDLIYGVNGHLVADARALKLAIQSSGTNGLLSISLLRRSQTPTPQTLTVQVRLRANPKGDGSALLGVEVTQGSSYQIAYRIRISTGTIGGPSAGLAFALSLVQQLGYMNLTHGRQIAATGTIDAHGTIGDVGGVAQKTIAVEKAGATIFLVPPQEYQVARANADRNLKVFAVSTLLQAIQVLQKQAMTLAKP